MKTLFIAFVRVLAIEKCRRKPPKSERFPEYWRTNARQRKCLIKIMSIFDYFTYSATRLCHAWSWLIHCISVPSDVLYSHGWRHATNHVSSLFNLLPYSLFLINNCVNLGMIWCASIASRPRVCSLSTTWRRDCPARYHCFLVIWCYTGRIEKINCFCFSMVDILFTTIMHF